MLTTTVTESAFNVQVLETSLQEQKTELLKKLTPALQDYFTSQISIASDIEARRDYAVLMGSSNFVVEDKGITLSAIRLGQPIQHKVLFADLHV